VASGAGNPTATITEQGAIELFCLIKIINLKNYAVQNWGIGHGTSLMFWSLAFSAGAPQRPKT